MGQLKIKDKSQREGYRQGEAIAILRYARVSPLKARLVLSQIHGKSVGEALYLLKVLPKKGARIIENVLKSAIANAEQKGLDLDRLYVKKAVADRGPMFRKWLPRAHGRATMLRKRLSHITIVLAEKQEEQED
ncbi:LSU ribosomal protein L22P [Hydrogenivirga caldilitoris]|uniref:Large ribosomal subunit protein uL22 n=1 Tax=Hydrogenivirga caldilitoris TaxID=246264 RepID=A0A497XS52_9AQUI|nr:50S ribosomal protein L22 [Hydrogenivirga caldilitoris]RLJ69753.1 LSU ribosomal protein L22P [Hydrogenivirga caldilitoris]